MQKNRASKTSAGTLPATLHPLIVRRPDLRLKNSLQQVAALLQHQAVGEAPMRPADALTDAAARLKAVAHWHAFLSRIPNRKRRSVEMDVYLRAFADHFADVFALRSRIVLLVNADPVKVPARTAGILGQIVNEFALNAVRRSYRSRSPGVIQIECGTGPDGSLVLQVTDDGKGRAYGSGPHELGAFGMQIVAALVKQLGGAFTAPKPGAQLRRVTIPRRGRAPSASGKRRAKR